MKRFVFPVGELMMSITFWNADLREGLDLEGVTEDRVHYLGRVIQRRTALEKLL